MAMEPQNPVEWLVFQTMLWTWPLYAFGALYAVGPILGWALGGFVALVLYLGPIVRNDLQPTGPIPAVIWAWIGCMLAMLFILWIGLANWSFSPSQVIRSSVGWAKGWALMALFPLVGAAFPIRRLILVRGHCMVGLCTLCLLPLLLIAPLLGLPERLYTSPLKILGGPGSEYFAVFFYSIDPSNMSPRWQFFAPWSPFAALLGVTTVIFALEETVPKWRAIGVAAGVVMVLMSKSRMGLVGLVICPIAPRCLAVLAYRRSWQVISIGTIVLTLLNGPLLRSAEAALRSFKEARADSTRVRETLGRIAIERWQQEAFWFGHGRVAPGSHLVEYMPIGSHHTWYGLLFVKGALGFLALAIPLLWQLTLALSDTMTSSRGMLPLGVLLVFLLMSFGENIEIEVYLFWPSLILLGIHAREIEAGSVR